MDFPVIVIDSNSIKSGEDEEDIFIENSQRDEYPFIGKNSLRIQTHSNNDDGDSGIHESNEVLGPSPAPSHKLLLGPSTNHSISPGLQRAKRSLSANSLIERKRSFSQSFMKSGKNRNYSIDTGRPSSIQIKKSFSPYKLMILDEDGKTILVQRVSRDSVRSMTQREPIVESQRMEGSGRKPSESRYMNDLCQIHLLLIIMKIVLGGSVTVFGLCLKGFSVSLETKDCGYWASSLLFVSGVISLYFATDRTYCNNKKLHKMYLVSTLIVSLSSSVLCMIASVYSGAHGNWISFYADDCNHRNISLPPYLNLICCQDKTNIEKSLFSSIMTIPPKIQNDTCICVRRLESQRLYLGLSCNYLFSSLKDYFVLICSLMAVGSGCDMWFVVYLLRELCRPRRGKRDADPEENYETDVHIGKTHQQLPSPIIPVVLFPQLKRMQTK